MMSFDKDTHIVRQVLCPTCGYAPDRATAAISHGEAREPRPGDVSLCMGCGTVLQFDDSMGLKHCTFNTLNDLNAKERLMIAAAQRWIRDHPLPKRGSTH